MSSKKIQAFVDRLARTKPTPHSINHYGYDAATNDIRRKNLTEYLTIVHKARPSVLIVGEAPGYRGTRRTGVPFSSEKIVLSHPFFTSRATFAIEHVGAPTAESSASIVWKTMDELGFYPLIWAAFPFHPHEPGDTESNRAPTKDELLLGQGFLKDLMEIFSITEVVAIGRAAEKTLGMIDIIPTAQIRHPSHGGANLFRKGLADFARTRPR